MSEIGKLDAKTAFRDAMALHKAGRHADAEALCAKALQLHPNNADLWNLRGVNFRVARKYGEAIGCLRQGLALAPRQAALWSNLGNALKDAKQCESAVFCHRRALELEPDSVTGLHNLGIALSTSGRDGDAIATYDRALVLAPDNADVRWDRAFARLRTGDFAGGWQDYEVRTARGSFPKRAMPGSRWSGEAYPGKRLLIVSEQGLGDTIWAARYFRKVKALGGELIIECRPEVLTLVAAMNVADRVVPKGDPLPDADLHVLQMSLPGMFSPSGDDIPAAPYLTPSPDHIKRIAPAFESAGKRLRLGIVWGGSVTYDWRGDRDGSLPRFIQHFALPGVQLYGLQKGPQAKDLKPGMPVIDLSPLTADMAETAAAIAQLDLVVMTDTAVAHLTGAIGKPVWLLVNRVPHWLWQQDRADTPWYGSMRLFRQRVWGDWNGVFDSAAAALFELVMQGR